MRAVPSRLVVLVLTVGLLAGLLILPASAADNHAAAIDLTFPVDGPTRYIDDYHTSRSRGAHGATDLMADHGQHVHAAVGGRVSLINGLDDRPPSWGYAIHIDGDDGRTYVYLHLGRQDGPARDAYAAGLRKGSRVERGEHIGYVGSSGNADPSAPHLHFEIRDTEVRDRYGDARRNPYASLRDAESRGDVPGAANMALEPGPFDDVASDHAHVTGIEHLLETGITLGCRDDGSRYCPGRSVSREQMATFLYRALDLPEAPRHHFDDVAPGSVHAEAINAVAEAGIARGDRHGDYRPKEAVRRDQMASLLAGALELDTEREPGFSDVDPRSVHAGAVGAVAEEGIAQGHRDGRYRPADDVSRAQMASFLRRADLPRS